MKEDFEGPGEALQRRRERQHFGYPDRVVALVIGPDQLPERVGVRNPSRSGRRRSRADAVAIEPLRVRRISAERRLDGIAAEQRGASMAGTSRRSEQVATQGIEKRLERQRLQDPLQDRLRFFDVHAAPRNLTCRGLEAAFDPRNAQGLRIKRARRASSPRPAHE